VKENANSLHQAAPPTIVFKMIALDLARDQLPETETLIRGETPNPLSRGKEVSFRSRIPPVQGKGLYY